MLRLKDPDEIEQRLEQFTARLAAAQRLIATNADLPPTISEHMSALAATDQHAIDKFLVGDNSEAFETMLTVAPEQFEALLKAIGEHSASVEAATSAEAAAGDIELARTLRWSAVACAALVLLLVVYGWSFSRTITRQLRRLATNLSDASGQVANAATQVSQASQTIAQAASQQAASVEETSASLEEISSMTRHNADSARQAKEFSGQTRTAADTGAADMAAMKLAMDEIKSSSNGISKIIKTIDEIAFQTNILALNAAVEAARAGESGMGFAVVADEVRSLAQRSAQSARETAEKIEEAISRSEHGVEISAKVGVSLGEIVEKTRRVDELVAQIATASVEQTQGITQVNTAVTQMDGVTQSSAANAEETAAAAEELSAQSHVLRDSVMQLLTLIDGSRAKSKSTADAEPRVAPEALKRPPTSGRPSAHRHGPEPAMHHERN
jgi:methyl-accepting chemotaxis protein